MNTFFILKRDAFSSALHLVYINCIRRVGRFWAHWKFLIKGKGNDILVIKAEDLDELKINF